MKLFRLAKRAANPRDAQLFNLKVTHQRERSDLHALGRFKAKLVWRKAGNVVEIRTKAKLAENDLVALELVLDRSEIFLMASRFLAGMPEDKFLDLVRREGGLS